MRKDIPYRAQGGFTQGGEARRDGWSSETWTRHWLNNQLHRQNGPAYYGERIQGDVKIFFEEFHWHGELIGPHRYKELQCDSCDHIDCATKKPLEYYYAVDDLENENPLLTANWDEGKGGHWTR